MVARCTGQRSNKKPTFMLKCRVHVEKATWFMPLLSLPPVIGQRLVLKKLAIEVSKINHFGGSSNLELLVFFSLSPHLRVSAKSFPRIFLHSVYQITTSYHYHLQNISFQVSPYSVQNGQRFPTKTTHPTTGPPKVTLEDFKQTILTSTNLKDSFELHFPSWGNLPNGDFVFSRVFFF